MVKNYIKFLFFFLFFFTSQLFAQQKNMWSRIDEAKISNTQLQRKAKIKKYQTFHLKLTDFKNNLQNAPNKEIALKSSSFKMQFPDENGKMISFLIKESPVMHPDLAKKYPNNKSFIGVGADDNSIKLRFSFNELGLHAMIVTKDRNVQYIDPLSKDKENYRVYARKELNIENNDFKCFTKNYETLKKSSLNLKMANDKKLRTYRLALASTGEYSQYHIDVAGAGGLNDAQKKEIVLAAMTTAMTRVNAVYENDLAITMQLVPNNDDIIYLDPDTDPYSNDDGIAMLDENQTTCTSIIGAANYDIGHVFSTGGGGVAGLASACTNSKARGVTGSPNPTGDNFYFDFVAHEMGHQFGANHTFNGTTGNCLDNENLPTAVEPGSGSTLMAYAGLCAPQNVQTHSDLYFHIVSIDEIWTNITSGNSTCGIETNLTSNLNVPLVSAGTDFIIPKSTPYILKGQGSDADNDPITFCWEQMDNEITAVPPSETSTSGALYRSVNPTSSPNRYMPSLSTVANGEISSTWEVTPSVARDMNFRLSVRDNNTEAGQTAIDDLKVTVTNAAGPFIVTSQNTGGLVWDKNSTQIITWDVAGTVGNGVNVSNVNILLSTDGGKTFSTTLISNTSNDGGQSITVPNTSAPKCFVMVEAVGNFFYALNTNSFSIGEFKEVCNEYISVDVPKNIPDNNIGGITSSISINEDLIIAGLTASVKINHTWVSDLTLTLESPEGTIIELISGQCFDPPNDNIDVTFDDGGSNLICGGTPPVISGTIKPSQILSGFISESTLGTWKLKAVDGAPEDIGTIESWSLNICTSEEVVGIDLFALKNFKIYPNPSQGLFSISFINDSNSDYVEINLFDILGRKISQKTFNNINNTFEEIIDFTGVSKGVYLLQVKSGNHLSVKKIQIN